MQTFIIIWLGQLVSTIGSSMSGFALAVWAWEKSGQATALTLWSFFSLLPSVLITPFAGVIVDRGNRKSLMMVGDTVAVLTTVALLWLFLTDDLHLWHLYLLTAIASALTQIQELAYSASISLLVPPQHYVRVSSMRALSGRIAQILAPPLAGFLYAGIGFAGLAIIDIITFAIAITTLAVTTIPQPKLLYDRTRNRSISDLVLSFWQELQSGVRYILQRSSLKALLMMTTLFWFFHDIGDLLYTPMILVRTNNDTRVLGLLAAAAGFGGTVGAILMSVWKGPKRRVDGVLRGMIGAGVSKLVFGLGRVPQVWIPAQVCSSFHFPLMGSCDTALWMTKVEASLQGRVFATQSLMFQTVGAIAALMAGPLTDRVFEPMMRSNHAIAAMLSKIVGTGSGTGIAVLYIISSIGLITVGLSGYAFSQLQAIEPTPPDSD
ncbi:MFS transporter [Myxacorys almedinensis]|uniref:MFS transporter n=1 Tax=Myxacorys almedinensis A TaxID=2690445 RepID=A0A8J7YWM9_9CYAN|nr:MFS transporter [Myxacorys almedinensis]NDJ15974.1 MFS transporter [Myxacorys almedinensis A]